MTIRVAQDQVDNARLLMALDKAEGRESDEWVIRLANAKPAGPVDPRGAGMGEVTPGSASSRTATEPDD